MVYVGKNFKVKSNPIGEHGFSLTRNKDGILTENKHNFDVVIGDDVSIGAGCTIDKGSWRNTMIGDGTKIDNQVHVAHNVVIGKHCIIGPGVRILGSCEIGDYTEIWTNSVIQQRTNVGKNCVVGACSYVRANVNDNSIVYGTPARFIRRNDEQY